MKLTKPTVAYFVTTLFTLFCFSLFANPDPEKVEVYGNKNSAQVEFGIHSLKKAVKSKSIDVNDFSLDYWKKNVQNTQVILAKLSDRRVIRRLRSTGIQANKNLNDEGFQIGLSKDKRTIAILAKDDAGLMYGAFEVAEIIGTMDFSAIKKDIQNPYMKMRGTKFNIPLDVRTPSYSDASDAAQKNIAEMWNFDFWKEYIDSLARYRYNYISLWNMHPFPSLVQVPNYPEIALDDVMQSTVNWKEHYSLNGHLFSNPEIFRNTKVIKRIPINQKIEFWKKVMRYGKERNVDFYFVTWNIFTYGVEGKYGIDNRYNNPVTRDYFRQSVRQMFITYPDLAGIGLTTGENMYGLSTEEKEEWVFDTYGQGVLDAAELLPGRKITFIHRQHMAGARQIAKMFQPLVNHSNINFIFSFKYAKAHVYSSVNQPFHRSFVADIQQDANLKTIWTLRNDDVFYHRWGAPDFVRDFIKKIPHQVSEGYYYGSDQYIWGREFLSKNVKGTRQIEIAKHWYHWMMWGRLGYNPDMTNKQFKAILASRFPEINAEKLFEAWQNASMIYPLVTGFHWGSLDFQWYIESGQSRPFYAKTPTGYNDLDLFISLPTHPGTDNISIPDFVETQLKGISVIGTSPFDLADKVLQNADQALEWANSIGNVGGELGKTKNDIQSVAYMGKHYAHKIRAATYLALFRKTYNKTDQQNMWQEMRMAALYWRYYAASSLTINKNPLWTNRVGHVDWRKTYRHIYLEIRSKGGTLDIPSMKPTPGGIIMEAEDAEFKVAEVASQLPGYTGSGYLTSKHGHAHVSVKWEFEAPEDGNYMLEFRYGLTRQKQFNSHVSVNGELVNGMLFWESAEPKTWVWDRVIVSLKKGENSIEASPEGMVQLDHLNVIRLK